MNYDLEKYPLNPEVVAFLKKVEASYPPHSEAASIEEGRRSYEVMCTHFDTPIPDSIDIRNDDVEGRDGPISIRLYIPREPSSDTTVIYYHGGDLRLGISTLTTRSVPIWRARRIFGSLQLTTG